MPTTRTKTRVKSNGTQPENESPNSVPEVPGAVSTAKAERFMNEYYELCHKHGLRLVPVTNVVPVMGHNMLELVFTVVPHTE